MFTPKILWAHPLSLDDASSGSALNVRTMLEALIKEGIEVKALSSAFFKSAIAKEAFKERLNLKEIPQQVFSIPNDPLKTVYTPCQSWSLLLQTRFEQTIFFNAYTSLLDSVKPDVVMTYPDDALSVAIQLEAKQRGIPVVCPILNTQYVNNRLMLADFAITDSNVLANVYAKQSVNIVSVGPFIDAERVKKKTKKKASYITFINPAPEKGVALVARLLMMAEQMIPDAKFLIVASRANPKEVLAQIHEAGDLNKRPLAEKSFLNTTVATIATDMREIYAQTKVLLHPSLVFEGLSRVAIEANMNGIPVVGSNRSEFNHEGNIVLDIPTSLEKDYLALPTEEETMPWFNALKDAMEDKKEDRTKAQEAAKGYEIEKSVENLMKLLSPLLDKRAGSRFGFYK